MLICPEHRFLRDTGLRDHIFLLGKAVIKAVFLSDTDHVTDLIPEEIRVQAVAVLRLLFVVEFSLAAVENETVLILSKRAGPDRIEGLIVLKDADIY